MINEIILGLLLLNTVLSIYVVISIRLMFADFYKFLGMFETVLCEYNAFQNDDMRGSDNE